MSLEQTVIDWLPTWVIMTGLIIGALAYYRIRTSWKITQFKEAGKQRKKEETFEGSIEALLNDAPKNLKQIESELSTLNEKARREHLTPEQTKAMLARLNSEKDMLALAVKYGNLAKPLIKPLGGVITRVMNSIGGGGK